MRNCTRIDIYTVILTAYLTVTARFRCLRTLPRLIVSCGNAVTARAAAALSFPLSTPSPRMPKKIRNVLPPALSRIYPSTSYPPPLYVVKQLHIRAYRRCTCLIVSCGDAVAVGAVEAFSDTVANGLHNLLLISTAVADVVR